MARALRVQYEGAIYRVVNRGVARREVFAAAADYERFRQSLALGVDRARVRVYAYALMPNHFHLLVETPRANLNEFMLTVQTSYAMYFNQRYRRSGYVFEGPYRAKLVEGDRYLLKLSQYIHLNPVHTRAFRDRPMREKLRALSAYKWSSYQGYGGKREREDWMDYGPLGALVKTYARDMKRYVASGLAETEAEWEEWLGESPLAIGDDEFRAKIRDMHDQRLEKAVRPEDVSFRRQEAGLPVESILRTVAEGLGVERKSLKQVRGMAWTRGVAARMLLRYGGITQREAAMELGLTTGAAVSIRLKELEQARANDHGLNKKVASIERALERQVRNRR